MINIWEILQGMKSTTKLLIVFFCILCITQFSSCGKKGDPTAPVAAVPEEIKDLTAHPQERAIILIWSIPKENADGSQLLDLKGFKILRNEIDIKKGCLSCPKRFSLLYDIDYKNYMMNKPQAEKIEYSDKDLHFKNIYTYRIVSYNTSNQLSPRSNAQEVFWDIPSLPPNNLQAELKEKSVILTWEEPGALEDGSSLKGLVGYNLYRRFPNETYSIDPVSSELITTLACRDKGIQMDKDYLYTLRAVRKVRETLIESGACKEVTINTTDRTPPDAPTGLFVLPVKTGIMLKWEENEESDLNGYNIYRKSGGKADFKKLNETPFSQSSYFDKSVKANEHYTYAVTAIDDFKPINESERSKEVDIQY